MDTPKSAIIGVGGTQAVVSGGRSNEASGTAATVSGGYNGGNTFELQLEFLLEVPSLTRMRSLLAS